MARKLLKKIFLVFLLLFFILFISYLIYMIYIENQRKFYKNKIIKKRITTTTEIFDGYKSFCISRPYQEPDWISNGVVLRMYKENLFPEIEDKSFQYMLNILEKSDKRIHIPSLHYDREKEKNVKICYEINDRTCIYQKTVKEQKNLHTIYIGGC